MKTNHMLNPQKSLLDRATLLLRLLLSAIVLVMAMRSLLGLADDSAPESVVRATQEAGATLKITRDAKGRKVQYIDFSDAMIEGRARTPEGFVIQSRKAGRFDSLIELRSNFRDNIRLNSMENQAVVAPQ